MTRYEPPVERMNGLDAGMYFAENDTNPLQIASVAVFEGPVPAYRDVVRLVLTGDFDAMTDLDVLGEGIQAGFDELLKEAGVP